jgi:flagellar basal-body rod protein FlgF
MDSGLYTAANGMLTQFNVENNVSDNLANLQTPGYKGRLAVVQDFQQVLASTATGDGLQASYAAHTVGSLDQAPQVRDYGLDLSMGTPKHTGSPLDVMIAGNAFFTVKAGNQTLLTRNGNFHRDANGNLLTDKGYQVLDSAGQPVRVPQGDLSISRDGQLSAGTTRGARLGLAQVTAGQPLTEAGGGYYVGPGTRLPAGAANVALLQGYLEGSNVDMTTQTTTMISAQRAYEADSRMMQIADATTGLAVNELGKVSA